MSEPDLIRRQQALEKTLAKYRAEPFAWDGANCITMLRSHLVAMGHKRLPKVPRFTTAGEAKQALRDMGFSDVGGLLDSMLPRIPAARALAADIVLMGGLYGLDTVAISTGGGKLVSWHQDSRKQGVVVIDPVEIIGTWRA